MNVSILEIDPKAFLINLDWNDIQQFTEEYIDNHTFFKTINIVMDYFSKRLQISTNSNLFYNIKTNMAFSIDRRFIRKLVKNNIIFKYGRNLYKKVNL